MGELTALHQTTHDCHEGYVAGGPLRAALQQLHGEVHQVHAVRQPAGGHQRLPAQQRAHRGCGGGERVAVASTTTSLTLNNKLLLSFQRLTFFSFTLPGYVLCRILNMRSITYNFVRSYVRFCTQLRTILYTTAYKIVHNVSHV